MKNAYCPWETRRFVFHNTATDEFKETDSVRWLASIMAEWVFGWSRGEIWEVIAHAMRTGELVHIDGIVFIDTAKQEG